jgi:hypothetical protein
MDRFIAQHNIEHFERRLAETCDPALRKTLCELIAEAREQLRRGGDDPPAANRDAGRSRISGIVEQLRLEMSPARRSSLRRTLIDEEDRFGDISRRMDLADVYIEEGARRIAKLEQQVATLDLGSAEGDVRVVNLRNSREILEVFKSYRAQLETQAKRLDL